MAAAANITDTRWADKAGRTRGFATGSAVWGVVDEAGRMFATDGEHPSAWSTKSIAAQIAEHVDGMPGGWVDPA